MVAGGELLRGRSAANDFNTAQEGRSSDSEYAARRRSRRFRPPALLFHAGDSTMKLQPGIFASCLLFSVCSQAADLESPAAARKREMERTRAAILKELETAGGDWRAWYERVRPAWTELDQKITEGLKDPRSVADPNAPKWSYLHTAGTPPMFVQVWSAPYLMAEKMDPDEFLKTRPSVQVLLAYNYWLQAHHVDLIFVPVPKLVQVYPERILKNAPSDRILAPHMRKLILQLLDKDVEVLDL